jgi:hypothetical protein
MTDLSAHSADDLRTYIRNQRAAQRRAEDVFDVRSAEKAEERINTALEQLLTLTPA